MFLKDISVPSLLFVAVSLSVSLVGPADPAAHKKATLDAFSVWQSDALARK
jgi:hypothetical protein